VSHFAATLLAVRRDAPSRGDASLRGPLRQGWRLLGCSNTVIDQRWQLALARLGAQCGGTGHLLFSKALVFILLQGLQAPLDTAATYGSAKMKSLVLGYLPVFQTRIKKYIVGQLIVVSGKAIKCGGIVVNDFAGRQIKLPCSSLEAFERQPTVPGGDENDYYWNRFELDLGALTLIKSITFVDIVQQRLPYNTRIELVHCKVTVCGRGTEEVVRNYRTNQSKFTIWHQELVCVKEQ
jgi:hypothetical protein